MELVWMEMCVLLRGRKRIIFLIIVSNGKMSQQGTTLKIRTLEFRNLVYLGQVFQKATANDANEHESIWLYPRSSVLSVVEQI